MPRSFEGALVLGVEIALLIRSHRFDLRPILDPAIATVSHDLEQPRLGVLAAKAVEILQSPEERFLCDIMCLVAAFQEPACEIVCGIQMWEHLALEASSLDVAWHVLITPVPGKTCAGSSLFPTILTSRGPELCRRVDPTMLPLIPRAAGHYFLIC